MAQRWDTTKETRVDAPDVEQFLNEVMELCHKHNMTIGHEDTHGAFKIHREFVNSKAQWLMGAFIGKPNR